MASSHFDATFNKGYCLYLNTMKIKSLLLISAVALTLQFGLVSAFAQGNDYEGRGKNNRWEERFENLSAQDRQRVDAAHQKAMADPSVQAAHEKMRQAQKEYREAIRAAMLKADPSIQSILDKSPGHHHRGPRHGEGDADDE